MRIAFIDWGSLLWDTRMPLATRWFPNGPRLSIEFARISKDGRLTLVVFERAQPSQTYWCTADTSNLAEAREALRVREGAEEARIHSISVDEVASTMAAQTVQIWLNVHDYDAAVWTGLESNFEQRLGTAWSVSAAVGYLGNLQGEELQAARQYVERAPVQVRTPVRALAEQKLGWKAVPSADFEGDRTFEPRLSVVSPSTPGRLIALGRQKPAATNAAGLFGLPLPQEVARRLVQAIDSVFSEAWLEQQSALSDPHRALGYLGGSYSLVLYEMANVADLICNLRAAGGAVADVIARLGKAREYHGALAEAAAIRLLHDDGLTSRVVARSADERSPDLIAGEEAAAFAIEVTHLERGDDTRAQKQRASVDGARRVALKPEGADGTSIALTPAEPVDFTRRLTAVVARKIAQLPTALPGVVFVVLPPARRCDAQLTSAIVAVLASAPHVSGALLLTLSWGEDGMYEETFPVDNSCAKVRLSELPWKSARAARRRRPTALGNPVPGRSHQPE